MDGRVAKRWRYGMGQQKFKGPNYLELATKVNAKNKF